MAPNQDEEKTIKFAKQADDQEADQQSYHADSGEEDEDIPDDGEHTSEHSSINLQEYLKNRNNIPSDPSDQENESEGGSQGDEQQTEKPKDQIIKTEIKPVKDGLNSVNGKVQKIDENNCQTKKERKNEKKTQKQQKVEDEQKISSISEKPAKE